MQRGLVLIDARLSCLLSCLICSHCEGRAGGWSLPTTQVTAEVYGGSRTGPEWEAQVRAQALCLPGQHSFGFVHKRMSSL